MWEIFRENYQKSGLWPVIANLSTWPDPQSVINPMSKYRYGPSETDDLGEDARSWLYDEFAGRLSGNEDADIVPRAEEDWSPQEFERVRENFRSFDWTDIWAAVGDAYDHLLLVPAPYPWLVPGRLGWEGACNYGLGWREHARILRRWQILWKTELIALDRDTMWLRHLEPINDRDTALEAAMEAFLYCSDEVYCSRESLDNLAKLLLEPIWHFWWD